MNTDKSTWEFPGNYPKCLEIHAVRSLSESLINIQKNHDVSFFGLSFNIMPKIQGEEIHKDYKSDRYNWTGYDFIEGNL